LPPTLLRFSRPKILPASLCSQRHPHHGREEQQRRRQRAPLCRPLRRRSGSESARRVLSRKNKITLSRRHRNQRKTLTAETWGLHLDNCCFCFEREKGFSKSLISRAKKWFMALFSEPKHVKWTRFPMTTAHQYSSDLALSLISTHRLCYK
jgi:hypothetical protein